MTLELAPALSLRALNLRGGQALVVGEGGAAQARLVAGDDGWPGDETLLAPSPTLQLSNVTLAAQLFILERMAWSDQAATAAEVTSLQMFRDLFADEALRPGEHISVGRLTVMFTDLRGSTRLYRESGDAVAFGGYDPFTKSGAPIAAEGGAIVRSATGQAASCDDTALRPSSRPRPPCPPSGALRPLYLRPAFTPGSRGVTLNARLDFRLDVTSPALSRPPRAKGV